MSSKYSRPGKVIRQAHLFHGIEKVRRSLHGWRVLPINCRFRHFQLHFTPQTVSKQYQAARDFQTQKFGALHCIDKRRAAEFFILQRVFCRLVKVCAVFRSYSDSGVMALTIELSCSEVIVPLVTSASSAFFSGLPLFAAALADASSSGFSGGLSALAIAVS